MAWLELSFAMVVNAADSGSAGTILFGFGCAERMVSCGVAQELVVVGDFAVVMVVSGRIGGELFVLGDEEVLLMLVGISKGFWTIIGAILEAWRNWLVGCD